MDRLVIVTNLRSVGGHTTVELTFVRMEECIPIYTTYITIVKLQN